MYFSNVTSFKGLKAQFWKLSKIHHPDKGGDPEAFKKMLQEYDEKLQHLKQGADFGTKERHTDEQRRQYNEYQGAQSLRDILMQLARIIPETLTVEICGSWIWVSGSKKDTEPIREALKGVGFRFSSGKKKWYYTKQKMKKRKGYKGKSMEEIRTRYGSVSVDINKDRETRDAQQLSLYN